MARRAATPETKDLSNSGQIVPLNESQERAIRILVMPSQPALKTIPLAVIRAAELTAEEDRIEEIRAQIAAGTYRVDCSKLAQAIVASGDHLPKSRGQM